MIVTPLPDGEETIEVIWDTTGADNVQLWIGYDAKYFNHTQTVGASGRTNLTFGDTIMNGEVGVRITKGDRVLEQKIDVRFNCQWDYVFNFDWLPVDEQPTDCPSGPSRTVTAAYQPFENGFMVWVAGGVFQPDQYGRVPDNVNGYILVVINDVYGAENQGSSTRQYDLWYEGHPDFPTYQPPRDGIQQPIRGFGKIWHENPHLREDIGWATTPEQSYTLQYQTSDNVYAPFSTYFDLPTDEVFWLSADRWKQILP